MIQDVQHHRSRTKAVEFYRSDLNAAAARRYRPCGEIKSSAALGEMSLQKLQMANQMLLPSVWSGFKKSSPRLSSSGKVADGLAGRTCCSSLSSCNQKQGHCTFQDVAGVPDAADELVAMFKHRADLSRKGS